MVEKDTVYIIYSHQPSLEYQHLNRKKKIVSFHWKSSKRNDKKRQNDGIAVRKNRIHIKITPLSIIYKEQKHDNALFWIFPFIQYPSPQKQETDTC